MDRVKLAYLGKVVGTVTPTEADSEKIKMLCRLALARDDLRACLSYCYLHRYSKDLEPSERISRFELLVISYGRVFHRANPLGKLPKEWGKFEDESMQKMHHKLIDYRDKLVAHKDLINQTVAIGVPMHERRNSEKKAVVMVSGKIATCTAEEIKDYRRLIAHLFKKIDTRINAELQSICTEDLKPGELFEFSFA